MTRLLPLILLLCISSCVSRESHYRKEFNRYIDSSNCYHDKWNCLFDSGKYKEADIILSIRKPFSDSVDKYYALMYPTGNPYGKRKKVCDCK